MLYVCVVTFFGLCKWDGCGSKSPPCWNPWYPINSSPSDVFQPESHPNFDIWLLSSKWLTPGWNFKAGSPNLSNSSFDLSHFSILYFRMLWIKRSFSRLRVVSPGGCCRACVGSQRPYWKRTWGPALVIQTSYRRRFKCEREERVRMNHGFGWCFTTVIFYISDQLWKDATNICRAWKVLFEATRSKRQTKRRLPVVVWLPLQGQSLLLEKQMKASWKSFVHLVLLMENAFWWSCWDFVKSESVRLKDVNFVINNAISHYDIDYINWLFRFCPSNQQKSSKIGPPTWKLLGGIQIWKSLLSSFMLMIRDLLSKFTMKNCFVMNLTLVLWCLDINSL